MQSRLFLIVAGWLVASVPALLIAQTYAQADVQYGARLYGQQCTVCHGATGDAVNGVDLRANRFKHSSTDNDLRNVISNGVEGTGMPPFKFDPPELTAVVAYLRNMRDFDSKTILIGDAARGKVVFEAKGECARCHRVNGVGARTGPDLSDVGRLRHSPDIEQSILDPDVYIIPGNRTVRLAMRDGTAISGRLLNQDTFTVQILDSKEQLQSLPRSNIREFTFVDKSPMPPYRGKLSSQEMTDLVSYLVSLKGTAQ